MNAETLFEHSELSEVMYLHKNGSFLLRCLCRAVLATSEMSDRLCVRPSVRLSVTRVNCYRMKETCAHILEERLS